MSTELTVYSGLEDHISVVVLVIVTVLFYWLIAHTYILTEFVTVCFVSKQFIIFLFTLISIERYVPLLSHFNQSSPNVVKRLDDLKLSLISFFICNTVLLHLVGRLLPNCVLLHITCHDSYSKCIVQLQQNTSALQSLPARATWSFEIARWFCVCHTRNCEKCPNVPKMRCYSKSAWLSITLCI